MSTSLYVSNVPLTVTGQMLLPTEAREVEPALNAWRFEGWRCVNRAARGRST